jgi:hypothetical protein
MPIVLTSSRVNSLTSIISTWIFGVVIFKDLSACIGFSLIPGFNEQELSIDIKKYFKFSF